MWSVCFWPLFKIIWVTHFFIYSGHKSFVQMFCKCFLPAVACLFILTVFSREGFHVDEVSNVLRNLCLFQGYERFPHFLRNFRVSFYNLDCDNFGLSMVWIRVNFFLLFQIPSFGITREVYPFPIELCWPLCHISINHMSGSISVAILIASQLFS